ncbi:MAG: hypothetical protein DRJ65_19670 [Acidobacteria bacterium]|nr:MAG: hypothetical protein DRJ65_19670 [Acidobacteriota bacterium]
MYEADEANPGGITYALGCLGGLAMSAGTIWLVFWVFNRFGSFVGFIFLLFGLPIATTLIYWAVMVIIIPAAAGAEFISKITRRTTSALDLEREDDDSDEGGFVDEDLLDTESFSPDNAFQTAARPQQPQTNEVLEGTNGEEPEETAYPTKIEAFALSAVALGVLWAILEAFDRWSFGVWMAFLCVGVLVIGKIVHWLYTSMVALAYQPAPLPTKDQPEVMNPEALYEQLLDARSGRRLCCTNCGVSFSFDSLSMCKVCGSVYCYKCRPGPHPKDPCDCGGEVD